MKTYLKLITKISTVILSITLIWAGYMKIFTNSDTLADMWPWTANNQSLVLIAGIFDILLGIGIIIPYFIKFKFPWKRYAAIGIILFMVSAALFHISRGEITDIGINVFVIVLALLIVFNDN